jgi:hypothetical protein
MKPHPETKPEEKQEDVENIENVKIPQKTIYGHNLKKLKSFKKIRQSYKMKNMKATFVNDLSVILKEYSPNDTDNDLNDELLLEILNIAEEYFIYPYNKQEREQIKKESVFLLMKPYFRNDEILLEKTIKNIWNRVNKSNTLKRVYRRIKLFFLQK